MSEMKTSLTGNENEIPSLFVSFRDSQDEASH